MFSRTFPLSSRLCQSFLTFLPQSLFYLCYFSLFSVCLSDALHHILMPSHCLICLVLTTVTWSMIVECCSGKKSEGEVGGGHKAAVRSLPVEPLMIYVPSMWHYLAVNQRVTRARAAVSPSVSLIKRQMRLLCNVVWPCQMNLDEADAVSGAARSRKKKKRRDRL